MQKKLKKIQLSILTDLRKKADELDKIRLKAEREMDQDYTQLRVAEREVRKLQPLTETEFKNFLGMIQKIESERDLVLKQIQEAEKNFGFKMDQNEINAVNGILSVAQRSEENLRNDANKYNLGYRALIAAIAKI
jgi:hypothetical protein